MIIEFSKTHNKVMTPTRANPSDAGLDVYADLEKSVTVKPGENTLVPTGLKFGIPHGYMLQVCNRSGMGAKKSLVVGAHIVDSGYDGEVFIDIHNIGSSPQTISVREKIAQLVMVPVVHFRAHETQKDLYSSSITMSGRGDGSLGSTDATYGDGACMKGIKPKEEQLPHPLNGMPSGF